MTSQSFTTTNYTNTESGSIQGTGHNTQAEIRDSHFDAPSIDPLKTTAKDDLDTGYKAPTLKQCQAFGSVTENGNSSACCTNTVATHRYCFTCHKFVFEFTDDILLWCVVCDGPTHQTHLYCEDCIVEYDEWLEAKKFHSEYEFDHEEVVGIPCGDEPYLRPVYKIRVDVDTPGKPVYATPEGILCDSKYVRTKDSYQFHQDNFKRWIVFYQSDDDDSDD